MKIKHEIASSTMFYAPGLIRNAKWAYRGNHKDRNWARALLLSMLYGNPKAQESVDRILDGSIPVEFDDEEGLVSFYL